MYTIGLWEFLELHSNLKDSDDGTGKTPHCLESESFIPGDYVYWIIWSLRLDASGLHPPLFLNIGEPGHKLTGKFEKWITTCPLSVIEHAKDIRKSRSIGNVLGRALIPTIEAVLCIIFLAFAVLIPASCTLLPFQSAISLWWDIYDVAKARAANAHIIVVNPDYRPGSSFQNKRQP